MAASEGTKDGKTGTSCWRLSSRSTPLVHFNSSLSPSSTLPVLYARTFKTVQRDKWRLHLRILLLRVGGGCTRVVISDEKIWQVVSYADRHCCLRDRTIIKLLLVRGLRTGEICTLLAEKINWKTATVYVFDSKKKQYLPVPVGLETLVMLETLLNGRSKGYVFQHRRKGKAYADKPLTVQAVWELVRRIAVKAGVDGFNPRMFRRFYAAFWMKKAKGELEGLQTIMRHADSQVTWEYADQFVFEDDVRREADRVEDEMMRYGASKMKKEVKA
jgi:integrase